MPDGFPDGRDEDLTCEECGARSREGYELPDQPCPEDPWDGPHDWSKTENVEVTDG